MLVPPFPKNIENKLRSRIQFAINNLGPKNPFIHYNPQFSKSEEDALKSLKISSPKEYNNYGNLTALECELEEFIESLAKENKGSTKAVSQLIVRLVKDILQGSRQETAWVAVRAFTPTFEYDLPRWHIDGYYYKPFVGNPYKIVMILIGAPTLFYRLPINKRGKFYDLIYEGTKKNNYNRQAIADFLANSKEAISMPQLGQGTVFIVGSSNAAVHSEPAIKKERLFLSVLPGSKEQIKEWKDKQH
ncbi:hypothetical protein [Candidatus Paracaedibacter symbiosus]|uniref:hypothetical protein n=1 Tax=Candidatus Paracaedibacter symbiosus TaxID=244582 RepID=UPI00050992C3|nr:hypothetical protein [Candidatus Paracaedibacter symbiosus]